MAASNNHIDVVMILLENNADMQLKDENGDQPIHVAAEQGHHKYNNIFFTASYWHASIDIYVTELDLLRAIKCKNLTILSPWIASASSIAWSQMWCQVSRH